MVKYKYRTIAIEYRKKRVNNWVAAGEPDLVGMQVILDRFGSDGWELVNLYPEQMEAGPGFGRWYIDTTVYRATFRQALA